MKKYLSSQLIIVVVVLILGYLFIYNKGQNQTEDWVLYQNKSQGFEIKLPPDWVINVVLDNTSSDSSSFRGFFGLDTLYLMTEVNLSGEVTPVLPKFPFCNTLSTVNVLGVKIPATLFSTTNSEIENDSCDNTTILNQHSINTQFCLNSGGEIYSPTLERGTSEYSFKCRTPNDNIYDFGLFCNIQEWSGIKSQQICKDLFDSILNTFK